MLPYALQEWPLFVPVIQGGVLCSPKPVWLSSVSAGGNKLLTFSQLVPVSSQTINNIVRKIMERVLLLALLAAQLFAIKHHV